MPEAAEQIYDRCHDPLVMPDLADWRGGDGSEHLHRWLIARPARLPQVVGSLCELWDGILPPTPVEIWRDNLDCAAAALRAT